MLIGRFQNLWSNLADIARQRHAWRPMHASATSASECLGLNRLSRHSV